MAQNLSVSDTFRKARHIGIRINVFEESASVISIVFSRMCGLQRHDNANIVVVGCRLSVSLKNLWTVDRHFRHSEHCCCWVPVCQHRNSYIVLKSKLLLRDTCGSMCMTNRWLFLDTIFLWYCSVTLFGPQIQFLLLLPVEPSTVKLLISHRTISLTARWKTTSFVEPLFIKPCYYLFDFGPTTWPEYPVDTLTYQ